MIVKQALLNEMEARATAEAKNRGLIDYAASDLVSEATDIVEDFFAYITWTRVVDGTIQSKDSPAVWLHRQLHDFESDWKYLELDREGLRGAAERYLERPWLRSNKMDWLILNVLTYAEYQAFVDHVRSRSMHLLDYVALRTGTTKKAPVNYLEITVGLGVLCGLTWLWTPLGVTYGLLYGWQVWKRRAAKRKIQALQNSMSATYSTFSTVSQSWQLVWDELLKGRQQGIVWDGIVYRLAEDRMTSK